MHISHVTLQNFRNFPNLDLPADQGFLVFVGGNGAGKTNFLEGVYYGASLRRFPESKFLQLFRKQESFFRVKLDCQNSEPWTQEVFVEAADSSYLHRYKINNVESHRNQYQQLLPVISFLPQDLNLLTRSPSNRRRYLNETLSLVSAEYRYNRTQYERALKQRNETLQRGGGLDIWNEKLAEYGSFICLARQSYLAYLNANFQWTVSALSPELAEIEFVYQMSGGKTQEEFLARQKPLEVKEKEKGVTLLGPHRDDFQTKLGQEEAVGFVSRGQMRSITLTLKILEKQYLQGKLKKTPIVLLDDVFSEFDEAHQQKLALFLKDLTQVFLTTAHLHEVEGFLPREANIYQIVEGTISHAAQT